MGTTSVETDRLLTDADFRVIRRLKKRAVEARDAEDEEQGEGLAMHMPNFDFMEERERLKRMTEAMREVELNYDDGEGEDEDADDEMDGEEEEELDFEGGEIIEEDEFEGAEEMLEDGEEEDDGDEEGAEEDDEEESEEGHQEVVVKGKKIEQIPKAVTKKVIVKKEIEINSSFYDDSDSSQDINEDYRNTFLSATSIYDPDKNKRRQTKDQIKVGKKEIRDEHKKLKLGNKMKERGRLTNNLKKKNNPFQMFIQKRRLKHRLDDLKKAERKTKSKLQRGHNPRKLGKAVGGGRKGGK